MTLFKIPNYFGEVVKAGSLAAKYFVQQISYRGKVGKSLMIYPYGMHASAKAGSFVQLFTNNNDPASRTGIAWDINNRPELADGDVCLYLPETGTIIKLAADGGAVTVVSDSKVTVTAPEVTISGTIKLDGDTTIIGNLQVNGDIIASGDSTAADHNSGVVSGALHTHLGSPTAPLGPVTPTGAPLP